MSKGSEKYTREVIQAIAERRRNGEIWKDIAKDFDVESSTLTVVFAKYCAEYGIEFEKKTDTSRQYERNAMPEYLRYEWDTVCKSINRHFKPQNSESGKRIPLRH